MINGVVPENTLLFGLDLDYSHFNSSKRNITWFGSKSFWVKLYQNIIARAGTQGVEIKFAIISRKAFFDDLCAEAATAFQELLKTTSTPMFIHRNSKQFCLVEVEGKLKYESLIGCEFFDADKDVTFSHVMLLKDYQQKSTALLKLANQYGIPANRCIMVDDTPEVLGDVASAGMHAISLACFHDALVSTEKLADHAYVEANLALFEKALTQKVDELIAKPGKQEVQAVEPTASTLAQPIQSMIDEASYGLLWLSEKLGKLLQTTPPEHATPDVVEEEYSVVRPEFRIMQTVDWTFTISSVAYHEEEQKSESGIKNRFI